MRKILLSIAVILLAASLQAQTVLKYQTHGLIPNHKNEMYITKYVEPGVSGNNVIWDFTNLELTNDFVGSLDNPAFNKGALVFPHSTTVLEEFGNFFFFKATEDGIEQQGFMSASGSTTIVYDVPFQKMKYPFTYGSNYSGDFSGTYNSNSTTQGTITGTYEVTGDGMGTLLLPGNMSYSNALRVKEIKSFTQTLNNYSYDIENVTYRWYVNGHRFPILVFIKSTYTFKNGRTQISTQAAYNPVIIQNMPTDVETLNMSYSMNVYPNPYREQVNISYTLDNASNVNLSVFDLNGRLVKVLVNAVEGAGEQSHKFSAKEMGLAAGAYLVKLNVNGNETTQKIVELK